jgi:hypothetical protein
MGELLKIGVVGCAVAGIYVGYLQFRAFMSYYHSISCNSTTEEVDKVKLRQKLCNHDWSTCLSDLSGRNLYDYYFETDEIFIDGQFYYRCERCQLEIDQQSVRITVASIGYDDKLLPGKLSLEEFSKRLLDQTRHSVIH